MAEATERSGGGPLGVITRKVGPLPVWAYVAIGVLAFYLYRRSHPSSSTSGSSAGTPSTTDQAYVPPFDAATSAGSGGIGSTPTTSTVNNYYYGDLGTAQASGGGTSNNEHGPPGYPPRPIGPVSRGGGPIPIGQH